MRGLDDLTRAEMGGCDESGHEMGRQKKIPASELFDG